MGSWWKFHLREKAKEDKCAPIPCPLIVKGVLGLDVRLWLLADIYLGRELCLLYLRKRTFGCPKERPPERGRPTLNRASLW